MNLREEVKVRLQQSIETMKAAVEESERAVKELDAGKRTELEAITKVQHTFLWASANAGSGIENALMRVQEFLERNKYAVLSLTDYVKTASLSDSAAERALTEYDKRRG